MTAAGTIRSFPILLYHSISATATPSYAPWVIDPGRFREQMETIARGGYQTLTVRELADILADPSSRIPERSVLITFDDGFDDVHREALPILERLGLKATVFVVTGRLGGTSRWLDRDGEGHRPMLSWTQVRELAAAGIEIGSHSHTHPQLDVLPAAAAEEEIRLSHTLLEDGLGARVTSFAYPYGYQTRAVKAMLPRNGYTAGCAVKLAMSHERDDPWDLSRAVVWPDTPDERFAAWLEGRSLRPAWSGDHPHAVAWRTFRRIGAKLRRSGPGRDASAPG